MAFRTRKPKPEAKPEASAPEAIESAPELEPVQTDTATIEQTDAAPITTARSEDESWL